MTAPTTANAFDFSSLLHHPTLTMRLSQQPRTLDSTYCAVRFKVNSWGAADLVQSRGCWRTTTMATALSLFHVLSHNGCCFSWSATIFPQPIIYLSEQNLACQINLKVNSKQLKQRNWSTQIGVPMVSSYTICGIKCWMAISGIPGVVEALWCEQLSTHQLWSAR